MRTRTYEEKESKSSMKEQESQMVTLLLIRKSSNGIWFEVEALQNN